jgi:hypothetical protein
MSTGPLNLNWISNAFKARPRSNEEAPASPAAPNSQASLAQDQASLDAGQQRYMAFAEVPPLEEAPVEAPETETVPPSSGLDVEWVTGSPAGSAPATSSGLGIEWRSGNSNHSSARSSSGGGLGVEWQSGSSSSGLGAWGGSGTSAAPAGGGLGVEWQSGSSSSGLGAWGGGSSGSSSGGLDVEWAGGSSGGLGGGLNGGSTGGIGSGLNGGSTGGVSDGLNGGSTGGVSGGTNGGSTGGVTNGPSTGSTGGVNAGGAALDAAALQDIQSKLTAPLAGIPEVPQGDNWRQNDLRNRAALVVAIRQDEGLQAALANWDQLPDSMRLEAGKRISALQGAVYGYTPAGVQLDPSLTAPANGYYDPGSGKLSVSRDVLANPREFVNTVTHEQAHAYQWEKGKAAKQGRMDTSDPLYATARAWYDNYFNYQEPSYGYQAYRQQPIEEHAFATGDAVAAGVFS